MQIEFDIFADSLQTPELPAKDKQPHEMTLAQFLASPDWVAYPDPKPTGKSMGMYLMKQPDGTDWMGGWIGKFKDQRKAKMEFHYSQVFRTVHWGKDDVDPKVLSQYPKLAKAQEAVHQYLSWIQFDMRGDYIEVGLPSGTRFFHILDFPLYCRVSVRGFVKNHGLDHFPLELENLESIFNQVEVAAIAIERFVSKFLNAGHRPRFLIPEYMSLTNGTTGDEVRFRKPISFKDGQPEFETFTGVTVFNYFSDVPSVEYVDQGKTQVWSLYPSQILAVKIDGNWKECPLKIR
ncbi:hypothetical protein [Paenibacillus campinasensis]|uniref:Uncharacterized protein n=1 Tax=Paenibacillus campinasensis TaxID=66347 RepID=A0A268EIY5_9BACL|nr:hypothetical protein [Paenibacillus campinasensis]PAD73072.1 hypothetical protein CHH67_21065 [Paenibacillus campinasensis]